MAPPTRLLTTVWNHSKEKVNIFPPQASNTVEACFYKVNTFFCNKTPFRGVNLLKTMP